MKIKKIERFQGFSLVEIMITMGILSVISYGMIKMFSDSTKTQKTLEAKDSMAQLQRELITLLGNEQNCSATFAGKHKGDDLAIIYQATNGGVLPKFYLNQEIGNSKISISSMKITGVDLNGDGSHASATLEVIMKKLSKDSLGGKLIQKEIKLSANLCPTTLLMKPTLGELQTLCAGGGKKITGGLKLWANNYWATCQDCSGVSNSTTALFSSCQSIGGAANGIDTNDVSKLACLNMGGEFNDTTNSCNFNGQSLDTLIAALQTQINAAKLRECRLEDRVNVLSGKFSATNVCGTTPNVPTKTNSQSFTANGTLTLGQYYKPGTLWVKLQGRHMGGITINSLTAVAKAQNCAVQVGIAVTNVDKTITKINCAEASAFSYNNLNGPNIVWGGIHPNTGYLDAKWEEYDLANF